MQYGGVSYDIGSLTAHGVRPLDIARALAKLNRYTGHSTEPLSVARHSVYVSKLLDINAWEAMYGLVHDVAETVVNDLSWPLKQKLSKKARMELKFLEAAAEQALFKVLKVPYPMPEEIKKAVKRADWVASATEKRDLLPPCPRDWSMLEEPPTHVSATPTTNWKEDADQWLTRYAELALHLKIKF
jgi:5'-deoxynucleotidase YfbR-like HD superfamily hydrolase